MKKENQKEQREQKFSLSNLLKNENFAKSKESVNKESENKKHSIYKESVFPENVKKSKVRNNLRNELKNFVTKFFKSESENELQKVLDSFLKHYSETYVNNDFSVNSVSNSDETKKDTNLINFLQFAKEYKENK